MSRIKLIVETSPYWHFTLDYMMSSIEACGFREMELWAAAPHYCFADAPSAQTERLREIKERIVAHNLAVPVFSPEQCVKYPWNIASPDPSMEKKSMAIVSRYVLDAAELGSSVIRIGTGWEHLDARSLKNRERSIRNMRILAEAAAELNLKVIVGTSGPQIGSFASDIRSLKKYVRDVGMNNVQAAVTFSEILDNGMTFSSCMDYFDGLLGHLYLSGTGGGVPGKDGSKAEGLLRECETERFKGYISLQITFRDCILTPDRSVFESADWLRKIGFADLLRG